MTDIVFEYFDRASEVSEWLKETQQVNDIEIVQYCKNSGHYIFYKKFPKGYLETLKKEPVVSSVQKPQTRFNNIDIVSEKDAYDFTFDQDQMRYLKMLLEMDIDVYPRGDRVFTKEQRKELYDKVVSMIHEDPGSLFER
jgi:hypothetical protein